MGILCFKKKLFSATEKGDIKEVPGRYGFWEKMVGLGESTSRNPEKKKEASRRYLGGTDIWRRWLVSGSQPVGTRKGKKGIPILVF
jgi:hypothetical protein